MKIKLKIVKTDDGNCRYLIKRLRPFYGWDVFAGAKNYRLAQRLTGILKRELREFLES